MRVVKEVLQCDTLVLLAVVLFASSSWSNSYNNRRKANEKNRGQR